MHSQSDRNVASNKDARSSSPSPLQLQSLIHIAANLVSPAVALTNEMRDSPLPDPSNWLDGIMNLLPQSFQPQNKHKQKKNEQQQSKIEEAECGESDIGKKTVIEQGESVTAKGESLSVCSTMHCMENTEDIPNQQPSPILMDDDRCGYHLYHGNEEKAQEGKTPIYTRLIAKSSNTSSEEGMLEDTKMDDIDKTDDDELIADHDWTAWMEDVETMLTEDHETFINKQNEILSPYKYAYIEKIHDTLQGELFLGNKVKSKSMTSEQSEEVTITMDKISDLVCIKKTDKRLSQQKIAISNGITFCDDQDAVREAQLLRHFSVDHKQMAQHCIVKYIDFFQTKTDYYLAMEYVEGQMTLKQFVKTAYKHIDSGKLKYADYVKVIKFIFFKLFGAIHWLHVYMKCCHLNICLENVIIQHCDFIVNKDENDDSVSSVSVNPAICAKLTGFSRAELFNDNVKNTKFVSFECDKMPSMISDIEYQSPEVLNHESYDARKQDVWSLGMMLFHCLIGRPLYDKICFDAKVGTKKSGYLATINGELHKYIKYNALQSYIDSEILLSLLNGLLHPNQSQRYYSTQALQHYWFADYNQSLQKQSISAILATRKKDEIDNLVSYYCYMY